MISNIKSYKTTDRFNRCTVLRKCASVSFISPIAAKTCAIEAFAHGEFDTQSSRTKLRNTKIDAYLALPLLDRKADPMAWWSVHRRNFRVLAVVTRRYLSAPPSSVASEQLFSGAGNIVTDKRCKLSTEKTGAKV